MGGLIIACIILAAACLILLIRSFVLNCRIRKLAEQVDGFNSGTAEMLDVALQEDRLAQLHNGIADLQLSLTRAKQLLQFIFQHDTVYLSFFTQSELI